MVRYADNFCRQNNKLKMITGLEDSGRDDPFMLPFNNAHFPASTSSSSGSSTSHHNYGMFNHREHLPTPPYATLQAEPSWTELVSAQLCLDPAPNPVGYAHNLITSDGLGNSNYSTESVNSPNQVRSYPGYGQNYDWNQDAEKGKKGKSVLDTYLVRRNL